MRAQVVRLIEYFEHTKPVTGSAIDRPPTLGSVGDMSDPASATLPLILHQLSQSLLVLRGMTLPAWQTPVAESAIQTHCRALQHHARQAEAALHRLRSVPVTLPSAVIDLAQAVTVLVLTADMLVQGHLGSAVDPDTSALVRRSAERAMRSLTDVQIQLTITL